ncbi:MAG: LysM peptidoglycan-binding domain-containing protein [Firmicutes bacterium]|nr:LysM peptidoglycan-binding domain-containing protein [Bacillota bacterium]
MKTTKTRKKYKIVSKFRFTMFLTVIFAVGLFVGGVTGMYDASSMSEPLYTEICVESGDTLWDLAGTYGPQDEDVRKVVHAICKTNDISASAIYPGQMLLIPVTL